MSRSAPLRFDGTVDQASPEYRWFVIVAGGLDLGTVWLERESDDTRTARLGIFLSDEAYCARGIGRQAIDQAIHLCQAAFDVKRVRLAVRVDNHRAIACYKACGFRETWRRTKTDARNGVIEFLTMEKDV